jgi:peptidoglycan-associated lipoprotein
MKHRLKIMLLMAAFGISACTNPGLFDNGAAGADGLNGAVSDPASPAYFQQVVGDRILFPVNQSALSDSARAVLVTQARWMLQNPEYTAIIEGHADERGTREYNLALGARRANSVQEFLISQGISADRLRTVTFGKERPVDICSAEACYSQNRRAVTVLAAAGLS